jgi:hypothetical protein
VTWAWTRTGAANDHFLVSLNGAPALSHNEQKLSLTAPQNETYFLLVSEVDSAGNASAPAAYSIQVDRAAPPAPLVTGSSPGGIPTWSWAAASGSDGARIFRYRLSGAAEWSGETAATAYAPADIGAGPHTLQVQERDAAGNWSAEGSFTFPE